MAASRVLGRLAAAQDRAGRAGGASQKERDERSKGGDACRDDAHAGLGGAPDRGVDVIPSNIEVGQAGKDDEPDDGDEADTGRIQ